MRTDNLIRRYQRSWWHLVSAIRVMPDESEDLRRQLMEIKDEIEKRLDEEMHRAISPEWIDHEGE